MALAVSAVGVMIGAMMFGAVNEDVAAIVAISTAAAVVSFALRDLLLPLLAIGMVEFFIATTSLMNTLLTGMFARLIAVLIGLGAVAYVALRAQRMGGSVSARSDSCNATPTPGLSPTTTGAATTATTWRADDPSTSSN